MKTETIQRPPERDPHHWHKPVKDLEIKKVAIDTFPYYHFDVWGYLNQDKHVFGVPLNHKEGMRFYEINKKGAELYEKRPKIEHDLSCKFHDKKLVPTKLFNFSDNQRIQFKCPDCYLTDYMDIKLEKIINGGD